MQAAAPRLCYQVKESPDFVSHAVLGRLDISTQLARTRFVQTLSQQRVCFGPVTVLPFRMNTLRGTSMEEALQRTRSMLVLKLPTHPTHALPTSLSGSEIPVCVMQAASMPKQASPMYVVIQTSLEADLRRNPTI